MARGYKKWVQESAVLRNPYWGKEMLECGRELDAGRPDARDPISNATMLHLLHRLFMQ
jgi:hypothetical protein